MPPLYASPHDKAKESWTASEESMASGQTAQPLGSKIRGRVPKGNGSIAARRPPVQSRSPTATRFRARQNRLPHWEGKFLGGEKDGKEKARTEKKKREGRRKERAAALLG
ncbi:hypothetical protein LINPERPRIM_LOCUS20343 [Linum perenne]